MSACMLHVLRGMDMGFPHLRSSASGLHNNDIRSSISRDRSLVRRRQRPPLQLPGAAAWQLSRHNHHASRYCSRWQAFPAPVLQLGGHAGALASCGTKLGDCVPLWAELDICAQPRPCRAGNRLLL